MGADGRNRGPTASYAGGVLWVSWETATGRRLSVASRIDFRAGECLIWGSAPYMAAEPEVVLGERDGVVGQAFVSMLGQSAGFSRLFTLVDANKMVRPPTLMIPKVQLRNMADARLFGGPVQAGVADGVLDAVAEGIIPREKVEDLVIIVMVWISPTALTKEEVDRNEFYVNNRQAMKVAIQRAMSSSPTIDELLAEDRSRPRHLYYKDGVWKM